MAYLFLTCKHCQLLGITLSRRLDSSSSLVFFSTLSKGRTPEDEQKNCIVVVNHVRKVPARRCRWGDLSGCCPGELAELSSIAACAVPHKIQRF